MSGIAGILTHRNPFSQEKLQQFANAISHRGKTTEVFSVSSTLGFCCVKSAEKVTINQFAIGNNKISVVLDGELYSNHLINHIISVHNDKLEVQSDEELIAHAYMQWGVDFIEKLQGQFVFALCDENLQKLIIGRDRTGQKPLFYYQTNNEFIFVSELQALLKNDSIPREINKDALNLYFTFLFVPAPHTIFKNIFKLPSAHYLVLTDTKVEVKRYWKYNYHPDIKVKTSPLEQLKSLFQESLRKRTADDKIFGVSLSGGIDSSMIVVLLSEKYKNFQTFSAGFGDYRNELPFAKQVADIYQTKHHEQQISGDVTGVIEILVKSFAEPFADSAIIPGYLATGYAKKHVDSIFNGTGGDELFGGFRRYERIINDTKSSLIEKVFSCRQLSENERQSLMKYDASDDVLLNLFAHYLKPEYENDLINVMLFDFDIRLTDLFLMKSDITSMAHGVNVKHPFLDENLIDFSSTIPLNIKFGTAENFKLKKLLKNLMEKYTKLPDSIINRRKHGFGAPINEWFRNGLKSYLETTLFDKKALCWEYLNLDYVKRELEKFYTNQNMSGYLFWEVLVFELWLREFMD